jgi:glycosyltransferase involved in cell wall biosynthesis
MYALQVAKDLRSERCDIAHINTFPQFIHVIRVFNPKIKIVLHNHTEFLVQLNREITERQLRKADLIIGCSEYITEKIRGAFPLFSKRCQTLYNGVDVNHFFSIKSRDTEKNSVKRLLFVGRISPEKGLHVLFDAFKKVVERFPKAHLTIVGPNSPLSLEGLKFMVNDQKIFKSLAAFYDGISRCNYFSYLQRRLFSLEISKNVTFTGLVPHLQLVNFYRNADVFVNSSFSEAFGMPLIEAMATKVPVVAPLVGGIKEIVENGKTGIIVEPCDDNSLAEAILSLLSDKNLRESMGEAARRRAVEIFSWERIVERLLRLYKNTCVGDFSD